jgi:serine/threonine-protein kinase
MLATDSSFRDRFVVEVESLKKLRHPNIVQLHGYGEQEGQLFYAMELIEGSSLQDELKRGRRFSWREVTQIAIEICAALKHAHDHGIIHRDLKPANLLYSSDEKIKLLDFGIAKLFGNTGATTGSVMGTADYMAPEQAEGKVVGPRTDLYSLGSVMYALLAGRPPFVGKSVPEVVHKVRFESPIPVCRMANDVPIEMEQLIDQLLEKNPQKRIPTALAAAHRLKAMEYALSVRRQEDDVSPDDVDTSVSEAPPSNITNPNRISSDATIRMSPQTDSDVEVQNVAVTTRDAELAVGPDHFILVDEEHSRQPRQIPWQSLGSVLLLAGLLLAGYQIVRVLLRPPSASRLYEEITTAWQSDDPQNLTSIERDIALFQKHYAADPRSDEIDSLQQELEQLRLQRRLEAKSRQRGAHVESPFEQLYLEYLRLHRTDPDRAYGELQALVQLLDGDEPEDAERRRYADLARAQLARQDAVYEQQEQLHAPLIETQLLAAQTSENPAKAVAIYQSILRLYGHKPWAAEYRQRAQQALEQLAP